MCKRDLRPLVPKRSPSFAVQFPGEARAFTKILSRLQGPGIWEVLLTVLPSREFFLEVASDRRIPSHGTLTYRGRCQGAPPKGLSFGVSTLPGWSRPPGDEQAAVLLLFLNRHWFLCTDTWQLLLTELPDLRAHPPSILATSLFPSSPLPNLRALCPEHPWFSVGRVDRRLRLFSVHPDYPRAFHRQLMGLLWIMAELAPVHLFPTCDNRLLGLALPTPTGAITRLELTPASIAAPTPFHALRPPSELRSPTHP